MQPINADTSAAWTVAGLNADPSWIYELDARARRDLTQAVRAARDPDKTLLDYRRGDFDLGSAWPVIAASLREINPKFVVDSRAVAPSDARILGKAYVKQVDVVVAQWARGPEVLVSTKSMVSSFRNNLPNRFEESYGDAKNLRPKLIRLER